MDSNAIFAILLLIVGLAILVAEIFIPSGGLLGVITFLSLVVSMCFAYRAWGTSHPQIFTVYCLMLLFLVPTVIGFGFYMLPRTSFGKKVLLEAPDADDLTPFNEETSRFEKLVGHYGKALTMLGPGGLVNVNGERLHALIEGLPVDAGASIQVVEVKGTRVIVRPAVPSEKSSAEVNSTQEGQHSSLDFDLPPNL
jgi:membrane-bound serine protease (ClpP class)